MHGVGKQKSCILGVLFWTAIITLCLVLSSTINSQNINTSLKKSVSTEKQAIEIALPLAQTYAQENNRTVKTGISIAVQFFVNYAIFMLPFFHVVLFVNYVKRGIMNSFFMSDITIIVNEKLCCYSDCYLAHDHTGLLILNFSIFW
jgi:hypothetical protein